MTATISVILNLIQNQLDPVRQLAEQNQAKRPKTKIKNIFEL